MKSVDGTHSSLPELQLEARTEYLERLMKSIWEVLLVSEEIMKNYSGSSAEIEIDRIVHLTNARLMSFIPTTAIAYYKVNEESYEFEKRAVYPQDYDEMCHSEVTACIESGSFGRAIRQEAIITITPLRVADQGIKTVVLVPMVSCMNVLGIMILFSPVSTDELNEEIFKLLELVCRQISFIIENITLYTNLKKEHEKLEMAYGKIHEQMRQLSILYDVGTALNFVGDLSRILSHIVDQAMDITESRKGALLLPDDLRHELSVRVVMERDGSSRQQAAINQSAPLESISGEAFRTGNPVFGSDLKAMSSDPVCAGEKSGLSVPLKLYGDCIGVITTAGKNHGREYQEDDLKALLMLASQAAVAIDKSNLYDMAITDSLTKLHTRRYFLGRLNDEVLRSCRYSHTLSLLMIDIDKFKTLNDTWGHQAGDAVLVEIAGAIRKITRVTDTAGRFGGEEFCILLPETPHSGALIVAERLRKAVEKNLISYDSQTISATMSIGVSTYPFHGDSVEAIIQSADRALYHAKHEGRNRVCSFNQLKNEDGSPAEPCDIVTSSETDMDIEQICSSSNLFFPISTHHDPSSIEQAHLQ